MDQIKELRERSGCGIADCKAALMETNGDMEKAFDALRKKGMAKLAKRADKVASAGFVGTYLHNGQILGVAVLNCETDFVSSGEVFQSLAKDIAMHVCASAPLYVSIEDVPEEALAREKAIYEEELSKSGKPAEIIAKMAEGKLAKFYEQVVLMEQPFVKDESKKIKDLLNDLIARIGEKIVVKSIARITI